MINEHTEECKCFQCGGDFIKHYDFDTGYGVNREGHRICFKCCGDNDRKELENMKIGDKTAFYFKVNDEFHGTISNWPGTMKIRCSYTKGSHNIAGIRHDVWFDYKGNHFHGVQYGYDSEICYIKRIKG